jgi:hypothetical protein
VKGKFCLGKELFGDDIGFGGNRNELGFNKSKRDFLMIGREWAKIIRE